MRVQDETCHELPQDDSRSRLARAPGADAARADAALRDLPSRAQRAGELPRQQQRLDVRRLPRELASSKFAQLHVEPVSGFSAEHHPQFKARLLKPTAIAAGSGFEFEWKTEIAALDKAVEQSNVKFSHNQHLDPDRVLRRSDSQPLNCADCHRLEPDGEHFEPITMENRCADCHELTFDPGAPDRQLPHGKPREVVLTLQDYFTRKFSDPNAGRPTRERRRLPGHEEEEQTCSGAPFDCAMRSAHAEIENQFTRRGCVGCHVVVDTQERERLRPLPGLSDPLRARLLPGGPLRSSQPPDPGQAHRRRSLPVLPQGEGIAGQQGPDAAGDGQMRGVPRRSSGGRKSGRAMRELSLVPSASDSRSSRRQRS